MHVEDYSLGLFFFFTKRILKHRTLTHNAWDAAHLSLKLKAKTLAVESMIMFLLISHPDSCPVLKTALHHCHMDVLFYIVPSWFLLTITLSEGSSWRRQTQHSQGTMGRFEEHQTTSSSLSNALTTASGRTRGNCYGQSLKVGFWENHSQNTSLPIAMPC